MQDQRGSSIFVCQLHHVSFYFNSFQDDVKTKGDALENHILPHIAPNILAQIHSLPTKVSSITTKNKNKEVTITELCSIVLEVLVVENCVGFFVFHCVGFSIMAVF
ncbi:hypothetical protein Dimus_032039 [Dionaea muscipula]